MVCQKNIYLYCNLEDGFIFLKFAPLLVIKKNIRDLTNGLTSQHLKCDFDTGGTRNPFYVFWKPKPIFIIERECKGFATISNFFVLVGSSNLNKKLYFE